MTNPTQAALAAMYRDGEAGCGPKPGLTEGNDPGIGPQDRDEAVVDGKFSGLDNDLIDMGQFGTPEPGAAAEQDPQVDAARADIEGTETTDAGASKRAVGSPD
jgi:hypothetical protein